MKIAALYARVSSAKQQLNENIASQVAAIEEYARRYVINVKPDSHTSLENQFARLRANGRVKEIEITEGGGVRHYFAWDCNLWLCESAPDSIKSNN